MNNAVKINEDNFSESIEYISKVLSLSEEIKIKIWNILSTYDSEGLPGDIEVKYNQFTHSINTRDYNIQKLQNDIILVIEYLLSMKICNITDILHILIKFTDIVIQREKNQLGNYKKIIQGAKKSKK